MFKKLNIDDSTKKLLLWKWCISGIEIGMDKSKCKDLYQDYLDSLEKNKKNKDKNSNY